MDKEMDAKGALAQWWNAPKAFGEEESMSARSSDEQIQGPSGIRGWLIFPAIALSWIPIRKSLEIVMAISLLSSAAPEMLGDASILAALFMESALVIASLVAATLFYRKKKTAVRAVIFLLMLAWFVAICEFLINGAKDSAYIIPMIAQPIVSCLWIIYFLTSRRVKNTFVW